MKRSECLFVILPLFVFLSVISWLEIRTGLIQDRILLPAFFCALAVGTIAGPKRWWSYPLGAAGVLLAVLLIDISFESVFKMNLLGGGTMKLFVVIGAAVGLRLIMMTLGFSYLLMFLMNLSVAKVSAIETLPSGPLIMLSVIFAYAVEIFFIRREPDRKNRTESGGEG